MRNLFLKVMKQVKYITMLQPECKIVNKAQ